MMSYSFTNESLRSPCYAQDAEWRLSTPVEFTIWSGWLFGQGQWGEFASFLLAEAIS
jgi:hypothetical protein